MNGRRRWLNVRLLCRFASSVVADDNQPLLMWTIHTRDTMQCIAMACHRVRQWNWIRKRTTQIKIAAFRHSCVADWNKWMRWQRTSGLFHIFFQVSNFGRAKMATNNEFVIFFRISLSLSLHCHSIVDDDGADQKIWLTLTISAHSFGFYLHFLCVLCSDWI